MFKNSKIKIQVFSVIEKFKKAMKISLYKFLALADEEQYEVVFTAGRDTISPILFSGKFVIKIDTYKGSSGDSFNGRLIFPFNGLKLILGIFPPKLN